MNIYFKDLAVGDKFVISGDKVFTKMKPFWIEDGDFGGYLCNAISGDEKFTFSDYKVCKKV